MGWAPQDEDVKQEIVLSLANLRQATYVPLRDLSTYCSNIHHAEKRKALLSCISEIRNQIDNIEFHLSR